MDTTKTEIGYRKLDVGYAWLVMVGAFVTNLINGGFFIAPGLLLVEWFSVFHNKPKAILVLLPSIAHLMRSLAAYPAGGMINRYGCRKVQVVGSLLSCISLLACSVMPNFETLTLAFVIFGFFSGLMTSPPVVVVYQYFDKYKSLASGLSLCGRSISAFVLIGLLRFSIDAFGWRGAMVIMAGIALNGVVCGMLFVPNILPIKTKLCRSFNCSVLLKLDFIIFVFANSLQESMVNIMYNLSTSRAVSKGMSKLQGSFLISCIGLASTVSRFGVSWVSNLPCTSHIALYASFVSINAIVIAASCILSTQFVFLGVAMALAGVCIGGAHTVIPAILVDLLGQENLANGYGLSTAVSGSIQTLSLPVAGLVYDLTHDFNNCFYLGSVIGTCAGVLSFFVFIRKHCSSLPTVNTGKRTNHEVI